MVGGASVRPDVCPQPTAGATVRRVYPLFPSPSGRIHCGVAWPFWTTCTLPVLWYSLDGIWRISRGGPTRCTGVGGAGSAHFAFGGPLWEGPCSTRREADPSEGWICRSTALGVCSVQAISVMGTGFLWDFGWGMGEGDGQGRQSFPAPLFPAKLRSVLRGSTTLPPVVLQPSRSLSRGVNL